MQTSRLKQASWECVHFVCSNPIGALRKDLEDLNFKIFIIENKAILNDQDLLLEISASMKFPEYFGNNWDALDECLVDFEWLNNPKGFVLVIQNSRVLWKKAAYSAGKLVQGWLCAAEKWNKNDIPFHLVFAEMD